MMRKDIRGCPHFAVWLPPHVGRRAILLFSFVILAFAAGGRCGAVSSRCGTLDGTLSDSADDRTHLVVFSPRAI